MTMAPAASTAGPNHQRPARTSRAAAQRCEPQVPGAGRSRPAPEPGRDQGIGRMGRRRPGGRLADARFVVMATGRSRVTVAWPAIPSPRPVKPRPSVDVTLTLTRASGEAAEQAATAARMAGWWRARRGRSQIKVRSALTSLGVAPRIISTATATRSLDGAAMPGGSTAGSGGRDRPRRARRRWRRPGHGGRHRHRCCRPGRGRAGSSTPHSMTWSPWRKAWASKARADPYLAPAEQGAGAHQVVGRGDLEIGGVRPRPCATSSPAASATAASSVSARPAARAVGVQDGRRNGRSGAFGPCHSPVRSTGRLDQRPSRATLDRVGDRQAGQGAAAPRPGRRGGGRSARAATKGRAASWIITGPGALGSSAARPASTEALAVGAAGNRLECGDPGCGLGRKAGACAGSMTTWMAPTAGMAGRRLPASRRAGAARRSRRYCLGTSAAGAFARPAATMTTALSLMVAVLLWCRERLCEAAGRVDGKGRQVPR